jgi:hypothetical protein
MTDKNEKKTAEQTAALRRAYGTAAARDSVAQREADRECKHPRQYKLRPDEPMHPYGLD